MASLFDKITDLFKPKVDEIKPVVSQINTSVAKATNPWKPAASLQAPTSPEQIRQAASGASPFQMNTRTATPIEKPRFDTKSSISRNDSDPLGVFTTRDDSDPLGVFTPKKEEPFYTPKQNGLAARAMENDQKLGKDWTKADEKTQSFVKAYYNTLDNKNYAKVYTDVEALYDSEDRDAFNKAYSKGHKYLIDQLDTVKDTYGKSSDEYRALRRFLDDYEQLGGESQAEYTESVARKASRQLDENIKSIYAPVIGREDFKEVAKKGEKNADGKLFSGAKFRAWTENASTLQKNLLYYVYETDGKDAAEKLYQSFLGDTLSYARAASDFASDIIGSNPADNVGRFWEANKANWMSALAKSFGGMQQAFTDTSVDPDDKTLTKGYTINDSIDDYLRNAFGDSVSEAELQQGAAMFDTLGQYLTGEEWYDTAKKEATEYQKQVLGLLALMYQSPDAAKETWDVIKERSDEIWKTVKGSGTLADKKGSVEGQLYRDYLGLSGETVMGDKTVAQIVWDTAQTTRAQYPQILANAALAAAGLPMAGRVLGNVVMGTSVYGNEYKQALRDGYTPEQAIKYAAAQAGMEFGVGMLLDGVAPYAGALTGQAGTKIINSIANPYLKAVTLMGVRGLGEGTEEYIQEIMDPLLRNWIFHEENEFNPFTEEAGYSFLLGGLSAMLMSPGNVYADINLTKHNAEIGKALNSMNSMDKIVDTILNKPVKSGSKEQLDLYEDIRKKALMVKDGKLKLNDVLSGELMTSYAKAGGDVSFLTNPDTVSYTKEQITLNDMVAGAKSVLTELGADVEMANDIAKLAMGQAISEEAQAKINASKEAQQVLSELQGDLDMKSNNALARAARMTTVDGALNKVYTVMQQYNPDKHVVTPSTQYLMNEGGLDVKNAEKIGNVVDKVLDGIEITEAEAKLLKASSPAIRGLALKMLNVELSEYDNAATVMSKLNDVAKTNQKVQDMQAGVKQSTKVTPRRAVIPMTEAPERVQRRKAAERKAARAANGGVATNDQSRTGSQTEGTRSEGIPGAQSQSTGSAAEGSGVQSTGHLDRRGQRSRTDSGNNGEVHEEVSRVIPGNKLDEKQRVLNRQLVSQGAQLVEFIYGDDSYTGWDAERGVYVIAIRTDGQFTQEQYAAHEPVHLWVRCALDPQYRKRILDMWRDNMGGDFQKAYDGLYKLYESKGYLDGFDAETAEYIIIEETLAMSRGAQKYSFFDFAKTKGLVDEFIEAFNLEAIGTGDFSNPAVQEAYNEGRINKEYYQRQGFAPDEGGLDVGTSENMSRSADEDPEYYQSIGLIDTDGSTAAFTDNINGLHEELLNQMKGHEGEDAQDFIKRGGVRVKPGYGIEVNGDIMPTIEQFRMIDKVVRYFDGEDFNIDYNINGTIVGTKTLTGADINEDKVYDELRRFFNSRKREKALSDRLQKYTALFGLPVKDMRQAYELARMFIKHEGPDPDYQEIIDTYEGQRYSADEDILNPESENYLGPDISADTLRNAQTEDVYSNQDVWMENDEASTDEDAIGESLSVNDEDARQAEFNALITELEEHPEREEEIWKKLQALQEREFNKTKYVDEAEQTPKKKTTSRAKAVAELNKEQNEANEFTNIGEAEIENKMAEEKPKAKVKVRKKTPAQMAFQPKAETEEQASKADEAKPAPETTEEQTPRQSEAEALQKELEANPDLAYDPDFLARVNEVARDLNEKTAAAKAFEPAEAEATEETNKPIRLKDATVYTKKTGEWWKRIGKSGKIEIRRRRSDRNTFDIRFTDKNGKTVTYDDVSPSMLVSSFADLLKDRELAKQRVQALTDLAATPSTEWSTYENAKPVDEKVAATAKKAVQRFRDNYGRKIPVKLADRMAKSTVRDENGALISTYRLAPANGVHNARLPGRVSYYVERPAAANTMRGMNGVEAYGQPDKAAYDRLDGWLKKLADPKTTEAEAKAIRSQIAKEEREMREYTSGVTRLDPWRPGFEFATPQNIINGKSVLEVYLDIRKPKVIDAKGKGEEFIQKTVSDFIQNPDNRAGLFDENNDPIGPYDGFKFTNARIIPEGSTLGGEDLDLDTVYVTLRNNQAKSTYNTDPTDSDFVQFSADEYGDPISVLRNPALQFVNALRYGGSGDVDASGLPISPQQKEFFDGSKYWHDKMDGTGSLKNGIIPLFQGANRGFGKLKYALEHARGIHAIFLSDKLDTSQSYTKTDHDLVDFKEYERLVTKLADRMGMSVDALPTFGELNSWLEQENLLDGNASSESELDKLWSNLDGENEKKSEEEIKHIREQAEAAKFLLAAMYNNLLDEIDSDMGELTFDPKVRERFIKFKEVISGLSNTVESIAEDLKSDAYDLSQLADKSRKSSEIMRAKKIESFSQRMFDLYNDLSVIFSADYLDSAELQKAKNKMDAFVKALKSFDEFNAHPHKVESVGNAIAKLERLSKVISGYDRAMADMDFGEFVDKDGNRYSAEDIFDALRPYTPRSGVKALYAKIKNPFVVDAKGKSWRQLDMSGDRDFQEWAKTADFESLIGHHVDDFDTVPTDVVAAYANAKDYDAAIIHDVHDNDSYGPEENNPGKSTVYVVFDPSKVKSVNNRTPTDSDYYNRSADEIDTGYTEGTLEDSILKIMADKDEDRALAALSEFLAQFLQTGVLPQLGDEKTKNIFQPRVTPGQRQIIEDRLAELSKQYGTIEEGENPTRQIALPRKTGADDYVRRAFRTAAESKHTPDRAVPMIEREVLQNEGATYQRITDKAATAYADREMRRKGYDRVKADWEGKLDVEAGKLTKNDVALGELVYIEAVKAGDMETAMKTLVELAEIGTTAGQVVQAFRMLKNMPKSYQLYYFQRVVNRLNRQFSKRIERGKMEELHIDKEYAKAVIDAKNQEEIDEAVEALIQHVADQIPANLTDKWNAWRYFAMLGNPKTHIRNYLGNAIFTPAKFMKDLIAAGLETTFIKDVNERQTSIKGLLDRKGTAEYRKLAEEDFEGIKKELQSGGKYNPTNEILSRRKILPGVLDKLSRINSEGYQGKSKLLRVLIPGLEGGDLIFLKKHYINSMTNFLATRGVSIEELINNKSKIGARTMNAARQYAFTEAQKATYRDASQVANALSQLKKVPVLGTLVEGMLPFTKTPINILKRGLEYSPVGLLKTIALESGKLKNGDISANEYIDNLSAGLTGTGIVALGVLLSSLGILRGGGDDDEKQADFDKLQGYQDYSINLGDNINYTIDWMAPGSLPLFVGNALYEEMATKNGLSVADITNILSAIAEPITQLSMLSGVNDALKTAKWDENPISSVAMAMVSGYASQGIPTLLAQISRSFSSDRKTTYVDKNSDVPQAMQRWWQTNVMGKTPLNANRADYIDAWGRKDTTQGFALRLIENMLSPGYVNAIQTTPVDEELQRLANATGTSVLMTPAEKNIEYNNETHNLTAEQYATYAKARGDATYTMLTELFNSAAYQHDMDDEAKAKAVGYIKAYGNSIGKAAVFTDYENDDDNWARKCDGDSNRMINMALLKARASEAGITASNNGEFYSLIINSNWLGPVEQGYAVAQQYTTTSEKAYVRKGGPTFELTKERKEQMYEYYRMIFPEYYLELINTQKWQTATNEKKIEMLSDLRKDVGTVAKVWLAQTLTELGVPSDY